MLKKFGLQNQLLITNHPYRISTIKMERVHSENMEMA